VCNVAKKKKTEFSTRINLGLTEVQTGKLNAYIIKVGQEQGKIPYAIQTKLLRMAFDEWMEKHGEDYDIDWDSRD